MSKKYEVILLTGIITFWAYFSYFNWIGSSEFWPVTLSGYWHQWRHAPSLVYKPIFHLALTTLHFFDFDSGTHLKVAKALFTLIGSASLFLIFRILRSRCSLSTSFWILGIIIFSQLGFTQFGKIRSDLLSLFFFLLGFWTLVIQSNWKQKETLPILIVFELLIIFTTPKAFLLASVLVFATWRTEKVLLRPLVLTHFLLIFLGLFIVSFEFLFFQDSAILRSILNLWKVGYESLGTSLDVRESFLIRWHLNLPLIILVMISFDHFLRIFRKQNRNSISLFYDITVLALGLLFLFFIHPLQPYFLIVVLILFLVVFQGPHLERFKFIYPLLFFSTFLLFLSNFREAYFFNNHIQISTIQRVETELRKLKAVRVLDGLGLAPRIANTLDYIGPNDPDSIGWAEVELMQNRPEFVIYTSRIAMLSTVATNFLQENYKAVGPGYWLRSDLNETLNLQELPLALFLFNLEPMPVR